MSANTANTANLKFAVFARFVVQHYVRQHMHKPPLILIVDDDRQLVDLFSAKLTASGFAASKAYDGKEGYELAKKEKPDLILLDLRMPVMNGVETLAKLKEDPLTKDIKVIILSVFNDWSKMKMDPITAKAIGAKDFIEKDVDLDDLVGRLRSELTRQ